MKLEFKYIILIVLLSRFGYSQTYFNNAYNFDLSNVIFTNIIVDDERIYTIGPIVNTSAPVDNSLLAVFNLQGEVLDYHILDHDLNQCDIWLKESFKFNNRFVAPALLYDSIQKVGLVQFDEFGVVDSILSFVNPTFPEETFLAPPSITKLNDDIVVLSFGYENFQDETGQLRLIKISNFQEKKSIDIKSEYNKILLASVADSQNNIIIGFSNFHTVTKDFIYQNVIQKRDSALNLIWEYKTPIYELLGRVGALAVTQDIGIVVSTMEGKEDFVNPNVNAYNVKNIIFYKLNSSGNKEWETEIIRNRNNRNKFISNIKELQSGDLIASGQFFEGDSEKATIIKLSSEGDSLWQRYYSYPGKFGHKVHDMEILADGSILLAGENSSPQEGWLLAVDSMGCLIPNCVTNVQEEDLIQEPILTLYPNPVNNRLNIQFLSNAEISKGTFRVYNSEGQLMESWNNSMKDHFIILDVHAYTSGTYYLEYSYGNERVTRSFVKQ